MRIISELCRAVLCVHLAVLYVRYGTISNIYRALKQEAFEKCWAHSPLRAAARPNFTLPFTRCRYCRAPPAHRCLRQRRQQRQRQRVTEATAMAP